MHNLADSTRHSRHLRPLPPRELSEKKISLDSMVVRARASPVPQYQPLRKLNSKRTVLPPVLRRGLQALLKIQG
jgi:hypothetical protein